MPPLWRRLRAAQGLLPSQLPLRCSSQPLLHIGTPRTPQSSQEEPFLRVEHLPRILNPQSPCAAAATPPPELRIDSQNSAPPTSSAIAPPSLLNHLSFAPSAPTSLTHLPPSSHSHLPPLPLSNLHQFRRMSQSSSSSASTSFRMAPLEGQVKVLFCGDEFPAAYDLSAEILHKDPLYQADWCPREQVPEKIRSCQVVVPRMTKLTPEVIAQADNLKLIVQFGVGLEGVDIGAATKKGIAVARIPSASTGNAASCAEHCIYLLLGLLRQQRVMEESVQQRRLGQPLGQTLQGKTVLISGYGAIGRELALRLRPFGLKSIIGVRRSWNGYSSLGQDPQGLLSDSVPNPLDVAAGLEALPQLLPTADAVVICNQLSNETRGMVDEGFLLSCKKGVLVVNIARGGILDYSSVKEALFKGYIGGLGLDVTWNEPFDPDDPILAHPNVIVTPHIGGVTDVSYHTMGQIIADTVADLKHGRALFLVEVVNAQDIHHALSC